MSPNINREPWDDPRVRQAFYMGLDKQEIVDVVLAGYGEALLGGVIPSTLAGHNPDACFVDGDVEGAKALLTAAGYPDGFTTKLLTFGDIQIYVDYAQIVREQAKRFGVTVELELLELGIVQARRAEQDFDLVGAGIGGLTNSHSLIANTYAASSSRNFNGYNDPVLEDYLLQSKAAATQEERNAILIAAQEYLCTTMPVFPLFNGYTHWGVSDDLKGWEFNPGYVQYFGYVWLEADD
jgi:peptide/nickel transport system substrate-binding protein